MTVGLHYGIMGGVSTERGEPRMAIKITPAARAYTEEHFTESVAAYLLAGDGFRADGGPLGAEWDGIFAELLGQGYMRRSQTRRYWWTAPPAAHPADCLHCQSPDETYLAEYEAAVAARDEATRAADAGHKARAAAMQETAFREINARKTGEWAGKPFGAYAGDLMTLVDAHAEADLESERQRDAERHAAVSAFEERHAAARRALVERNARAKS